MEIKVGSKIIGSNYIPIQTMIKNSVNEIDLTIKKIENLTKIGCDIIRITIPDKKSVISLKEILKFSKIPVVADIHFDYNLAILSIEAGVHKIRINPGNIGDQNKVKKVIDCLKQHNTPVRIGINSGSLPEHLLKKFNNKIEVMLESAKEEISYFEKQNYHNIVLSFKSSNVIETIEVNTKAKKLFRYPLHIGVTEAGDKFDGTIKNSIGISNLLLNGIGDTIRVSLTSSEEDEIFVAKKILESIQLRKPQYEIISCPTCGRTEVNIEKIVLAIKEKINNINLTKNIKIAVMGCIVNGPGEAKEADFGVACGKEKSILFSCGKKIKIINNSEILSELLILLENYHEK